jgi:hypothetical protein
MLSENKAGVEIKRFYPMAREPLKGNGYEIYALTGESIKTLRAAGADFRSTWHKDFSFFEGRGSMKTEVAIKPKEFFIPDSNNKSLTIQKAIVEEFSKRLSEKVPGVKGIIGHVPDYVELALKYNALTGKGLFGELYATTTSSIRKPFVDGIDVGNLDGRGLFIGRHLSSGNYDNVYAAPLVVPD